MTAFDRTAFGNLMGELPAGVAVITTRAAEQPKGLVVTSLTAFTADPPSVLVSVDHGSRSHSALLEGSHFGVHVLRHGQDDVAAAFAGKTEDKFANLDWEWDGDVPRLDGSLAYLRCRTEKSFAHFDHTVLVGVIEHCDQAEDAEPMVYLRRRFAWRLAG